MEFILVSACLVGESVRYNGGDKRTDHPVLQRWLGEGRVVTVCPEVAGGLSVPRPPAEIVGAAGGLSVLSGVARVIDDRGRDVTGQFVRGAEHALAVARSKSIRIAVLKEGSPSCGLGYIYDGSFTGTRVSDVGVTAACLERAGIYVFSEAQLEEADLRLRRFEDGFASLRLPLRLCEKLFKPSKRFSQRRKGRRKDAESRGGVNA
ncbi:MAG: DUF523 domain-containing protein [Blastocatellia bacterium]|nr:DUF523 domain-containing protein [Blastocatellia bacterium]